MARYLVLLEVDEEQARRASQKSNTRGIYRMPSLFCTELNHGKQRGYTKGKKFGWWVCGTCHRPSRVYWMNIFRDNGMGYNLKERMADGDL